MHLHMQRQKSLSFQVWKNRAEYCTLHGRCMEALAVN
jgi:hypothetical protein